MIATSEAISTFDRMLAEAGFDSERPDPLRAWEVFKAFAAIPVECADDGLLFQCGTYTFSGREQFHFNFTRQFTHEEDGEYAGMEQLDCTIYYEPTPELRALQVNIWSYDSVSLAQFFARVEALPEFRLVTGAHTPVRAEVDQENV